VTLARDGKEAWEMFNQSKPDICVLDVMMPEMDGFTLAKDKRSSAGCPVDFPDCQKPQRGYCKRP